MSAAVETGLLLEGLRCASCAHRVEQGLRHARGVFGAEVNYASHRANVRFDPDRTDAAGLVAIVEELGFSAQPYDPTTLDRPRDRSARSAMVRVLVAAFLAGNVMWLAAALYAGDYQGMDPVIRRTLRWLVVALSLPAATWCAAPFWRGAWHGLRRGTLTIDVPIVLGIATSVATTIAGTLAGSDHLFVDSAAMIVFLILLGRTLEQRARARASQAIERLQSLAPPTARRVEDDGTVREVPRDSLAVGDTLRIAAGEVFPADARIVGHAVEVDESIVTGESLPVLRGPGDEVPCGARIVGVEAVATVVAVAGSDHLARMSGLLERAQASRPEIQRLADRIAAYFAPAVLVVAAATAIAGVAMGLGTLEIAMRAAAVLIVACPCALGLATPAAIAAAVGRAANLGIWIREGAALERLAAVDTILLDKTGTLTEGRLRVVAVDPAEGVAADDVTAWAGRAEGAVPHPIADAIRETSAPGLAPLDPVEVVPGLGVVAGPDGDRVRVGRRELLARDGIVPDARLRMAEKEHTERGHSIAWVAHGDRVLGLLALADEPRADAAEATARLREAGLRLELLTGDHENAGRAAGARVGIHSVHAHLAPEDKVRHIAAWRARGATVAFVGDGINDAAALGAADVGLAMARGAEVTREAADLVLQGGRLCAVPEARALAAATLRRIRENLAFALAYNAVAVPLAVAGVFEPLHAAIAMSASSLVVVGNATRLLRFGTRT